MEIILKRDDGAQMSTDIDTTITEDQAEELTPELEALLPELPADATVDDKFGYNLLADYPLDLQRHISSTLILELISEVPAHSRPEGCRAAFWTVYVRVVGDRIWDEFESWVEASYGSFEDVEDE
ncbi:hypothetical protein FKW77_000493 [Venturia effusa]|uniref:Uncharacterized protein n=1 Tax=Venturia effusa TaxID=50376 RepID=A0A517L2K2_9PEZI|nr:hypothetical protein FKW77_000493 [Venturia effusa]